MVTDDTANLAARLHTLEQRNIALAKLLEKAMEDIRVQQREFTKEKAEGAADALSLAIAKIQFVQVYLENSTIPLPAEDQAKDPDNAAKALEKEPSFDLGSPMQLPAGQSSPTPKPLAKDIRKKGKPANQSSASQTPVGSPSKTQQALSTPTEFIPSINISKGDKYSEEPPRIRPALAQSSFSWILGEDQRKSDFVAASQFSTERERARGKIGFLFGDNKVEDTKPNTTTSKGRHLTEREAEEEEAINLGTMKISEEDV